MQQASFKKLIMQVSQLFLIGSNWLSTQKRQAGFDGPWNLETGTHNHVIYHLLFHKVGKEIIATLALLCCFAIKNKQLCS